MGQMKVNRLMCSIRGQGVTLNTCYLHCFGVCNNAVEAIARCKQKYAFSSFSYTYRETALFLCFDLVNLNLQSTCTHHICLVAFELHILDLISCKIVSTESENRDRI